MNAKNNYGKWPLALIISAFILIGLASLAYFWIIKGSSEKIVLEKPQKMVRIGISKSMLSAAVIIAESEGFFEQAGLHVSVTEYASGKGAFKGLLSGEVDISTVADTPLMFAAFKRNDFSILAAFIYSYTNNKLVARSDSDIETGADLRGKRVGVQRGTAAHFFLGTYLTHQKLPLSDVEIVPIKTVDLADALRRRQVDAAVLWEPYVLAARKMMGQQCVCFTLPKAYRTTFNLVAMKEYIRAHPKVIEAVLRAVEEANGYMRTHGKASQDIVAKRLNVPVEDIAALWDGYSFELLLDQSLLITLEDEARWAIQNRLADRSEAPDFLEIIYCDGLETVKPKAVSIIR